MKLKLTALATAFAMAFALSACSKYEEGPLVSFRSKDARVANTWIVTYAVEADGDNVISDYDDDVYIFTEEGDASITGELFGATYNGTGSWELVDDEENFRLQLSYSAGGFSFNTDETMEILKLTSDEFWVRDIDDDGIEIHFSEQ